MYRAQITLIAIAAIVVSFLAGWSLRAPEDAVLGSYVAPEIGEEERVVRVTIDYGNGNLKEMPDVPFVEGDTVFSALSVLDEAQALELKSEDHGGELGTFIVSIDGVGGAGDKWWQYWVNDIYAPMGASSYVLKPDDHVHFVYTNEQNL